MKLISLTLVALLSILACSDGSTDRELDSSPDESSPVDGKADAFGIAEGSALAEGVLALVNTATPETFEQANVWGDASVEMLAHRNGPDGQLGTADDDLFDTIEELDEVPHVGTEVFNRLAQFATLNGYVNHAADQHQILPGLVQPRKAYVSVQLPDGQILVTGGVRLFENVSSTELFDPASRTWTQSGDLSIGRTDAAAVVLQDGRVMVLGGENRDHLDPLASTEIWDPATGQWSAGPHMNEARTGHTATVLEDGRVFVFGGKTAYPDLAARTAEIFDPSTGRWREFSTRHIARDHTATRVPDGTVIITGGYMKRSILQFDPSAETIRLVGRMNTARDHHTATLVGDELIIVGGTSSHFDSLASTEVIDLSTFDSMLAGDLVKARTQHAAAVLPSGDVAVFGGDDGDHRGILEVDVLDPQTKEWSLGAPLYADFEGFAIHDFEGELLLVGGQVSGLGAPSLLYREGPKQAVRPPQTEVFRELTLLENFGERVRCATEHVEYHEAAGKLFCFPGRKAENEPIGTYVWTVAGWEEVVAPLDSPVPPRIDHTMTYDSARGKLVLFGGQKRQGYNLNDVWEFDGTEWEPVEPATAVVPTGQHSARIVYDSTRERSVLLPGSQTRPNNETGPFDGQVYAWLGDRWETLPGDHEAVFGTDMFDERWDFGAAYDPARDRVVVFGGWGNGSVRATFEYDGTQWEDRGEGVLGRGPIDAAYNPTSGKVVVVGPEYTDPGTSNPTPYLYTYDDGTWNKLDLSLGRYTSTHRDQLVTFDGSSGHIVVGAATSNDSSLQRLQETRAPNRRPVLEELVQREAHANEFFEMILTASDPDGHELTVTHSALPTGATFDHESRLLEWTPTAAQAGEYLIEFTVTDGALTSTQSLIITVDGLVAYPSLQDGEVKLSGKVSWVSGTWERDGVQRAARFEISCEFEGENPGRITYACPVRRYQSHPGARDYYIVIYGDVRPDGTLSGGLNGRIETLQWDDYELRVTGFEAEEDGHKWYSSNVDHRGYLNE